MGELDGWHYCPRCRNELDCSQGKVECSECGFVAYASSKPTASALCIDEAERVLLARRAVEPNRGAWDAPGGFLEEGEHPLDGLRRELREETGLEIAPLELLGIWMDRYGGDSTAESTLNLFWTARVVGGEPRPADDVSELRWFGQDELPRRDEVAFDCVADALSALGNEHA